MVAGCATAAAPSASSASGVAALKAQEDAARARHDGDLDLLIESAYVRQAMREAPDIVTDGVVQIGADLRLHPERRRRMVPALTRHWSEERLVAGVRARVDDALGDDEIELIAAALRGQPVRRMNELGLRANQAPPEELFAYLRALEANPPPRLRIEAIRRLARHYTDAKLTVAMVAAPLVSVSEILAITAATDEDAAMVRALHRAAMQQLGLHEMTPEVVEAALIFAYRDVPNDELVAFANFYETELGQRYHQALVRAYFETLQATTEATMEEIQEGTSRDLRRDRDQPEPGRVLEL